MMPNKILKVNSQAVMKKIHSPASHQALSFTAQISQDLGKIPI